MFLIQVLSTVVLYFGCWLNLTANSLQKVWTMYRNIAGRGAIHIYSQVIGGEFHSMQRA